MSRKFNPRGGHLIAGQRPLPNEDLESDHVLDAYYERAPMTYGIELQFLVPVLEGDEKDEFSDDPRKVLVVEKDAQLEVVEKAVSDAILLTLRTKAQVPAWTHLGPPYPNREIVNKLDSESQALWPEQPYSQWVVQVDRDLEFPTDIGRYKWVGIRVKSNRRFLTQASHFDQIGKVIVALRNEHRLRLAPSTSLNIHVGQFAHNYDSYALAPRLLRMFCTLWWLIEKQIFELVHPSRYNHLDCQPLRLSSNLAKMSSQELDKELKEGGMSEINYTGWYNQMHYILPSSNSVDQRRQVESIWRAKDSKAITEKMLVLAPRSFETPSAKGKMLMFWRGSIGFQGFCEGALPFLSRLPHNDGRTGTLEFRCMQGTLDPLHIAHWLRVVTRLYDFSRRGNTADIMGILHKALGVVDGPEGVKEYSGLELLRDLGLPDQADYFTSFVQEYKSLEDSWRIRETKERFFVPPHDSDNTSSTTTKLQES
ncbi:hypothetical protein M426DRAFT_10594 [Hypoxylon sp. CI-4A]|nr:hypothetical protein M426DRAFT_10594 [Hypoxylon sp. CI-4A]